MTQDSYSEFDFFVTTSSLYKHFSITHIALKNIINGILKVKFASQPEIPEHINIIVPHKYVTK